MCPIEQETDQTCDSEPRELHVQDESHDYDGEIKENPLVDPGVARLKDHVIRQHSEPTPVNQSGLYPSLSGYMDTTDHWGRIRKFRCTCRLICTRARCVSVYIFLILTCTPCCLHTNLHVCKLI